MKTEDRIVSSQEGCERVLRETKMIRRGSQNGQKGNNESILNENNMAQKE